MLQSKDHAVAVALDLPRPNGPRVSRVYVLDLEDHTHVYVVVSMYAFQGSFFYRRTVLCFRRNFPAYVYR